MVCNAVGALPRLIVVAAVIELDGRILCAQRKAGGELSLKWEFPGGKVEPGETRERALEREIDEELGLRILTGPLFLTVRHWYPAFAVTMHAYRATILEGRPELREHSAIRWLRPDELGTLDWAPADVPVAKKMIGL
ncbi:MAG TPA: (deoxy)nucleoside triphosphate pyrophosphohydrolase [Spirochaetales bacterium]|nr:(deoxy)nucleoside triphosphate pyrophosphohydrolase [Spirochaetales bacterium]HPG86046.1 (deoxy)nucleoside triphosphate pyrophosphohydrolase [Spirochaetales bacterium]